MDEFQSFVPTSLLDRVLVGRVDAPVRESFRGTALFADITRYTDLAERLCEQGSAGIEQLARFLDRAFRRYVTCIHDSGGEVACFAGDALLAYWPDVAADTSAGLRKAEECARLLHNASMVDVAERSAAGTLHIGIGTGDLWAARLGGVNGRWHLLLAGPAVRGAGKSATEAPAGETRLSAAARRVSDASGSTSGRGADGRLDAACGIDDFVPRVVKEWMADGLQDWLPQLRNVCALFVRIDGIDDDQPHALDRYQSAVAAALTAIQPYTGSNGTLVLDDKGLILKLCLGLPHDAHADDAVRAVASGLAVERALKRLGFGCAAAVASGRGVCMPVGGQERRDYVAVGRFMHVAARLMQQAGDGLLCTDEIADRVRGEFTLSPEGRVELKGLRGSLRPFRVRDVPRRTDRAQQLFGREFELKQLEAHLKAIDGGRGRIVWLVGEAGIGKTALVQEFLRTLPDRGLTCSAGGAASVDTAVPYLAWRPVFRALLDARDASATSAALGRMRHPRLAPLINAVLPGSLQETELVRSLSGDARADALPRVLSEVVGVLAPRPLILVLEDCHWMDSASWRLLVRIAQDFPDALLILTSRPSTQLRELESLRRLDGFVELSLGPLRRDAVGRLVQHMLEADVASAELIDDIVARSACNPLFVREYTLLLEATKRVVRGRARWSPLPALPHRSEDALPVPATVEGLIASRLDALTPEEAWVLKTASVLGDQFRAELLRGICARQRAGPDLGATLASLARNELLIEVGANRGSYAFRHTLIRQGAYEQLTASQRKHLHHAAAENIEQHYADDLAPHVATLAHHWSKAEVPERAVEYADRAASQALAAGAYLEADRMLRVCLELERSQSRFGVDVSVRWLRQAAEARHGTGQLESRAAAAREALARAGRQRPSSQLGLAVQAAVRAAKLTARHLCPGLRSCACTPLTLEIAQAYRHSAEVCWFNNDLVGMVCDHISAVECAEAAPPSAVLASASTELGGVLAIAGFRRLGERILRHAIEIAANAGDQAALAYAHLVSALYAVGVGDWATSDRCARFCQTLCEPMDDAVNWTNAQSIRFWIAHYRGQYDAAEDLAHKLQDRAYQTGNRQHQAWSLRYLALCELRRDRPGEAVPHLVAALECLGETAALNERTPAIALLALAMLRVGEVWAARAKVREGLALIAQVKRPIGHHVLEAYSALAEVVFDAWGTDPAASNWPREARVCLRALKRYRAAFPIGEARYWWGYGRYYELSGNGRAAGESYRRGEAAAVRFGMPRDRSLCAEASAYLRAPSRASISDSSSGLM